MTVGNPSYEGLTHRRTVWFVDRQFFVIADEASGTAEGEVGLHYKPRGVPTRRRIRRVLRSDPAFSDGQQTLR